MNSDAQNIGGHTRNRIQVFDQAGTEITRFRLASSGSNVKLFEQNALLAQQELITLAFTVNTDSTVVNIQLTLEDKYKNRVTMRAAAALRNCQAARARA